MGFRTKLDYSDNRQIQQTEQTLTILSGGTAFGMPFSALTSGPSTILSGISATSINLVSTFSGDSGTTIYTWFDNNMNLGASVLSAWTPSNSGVTQNTGNVFTPSSTTNIDGNTVALSYTGVNFDLSVVGMTVLTGGTYSGTVNTATFQSLSAATLDFTGRTIWVDVSGYSRTQELIITKNPVIGYTWTCLDAEGKGYWASGCCRTISGTGNNSVVMGYNSKASGDTAVAIGYEVWGNGNYSNASGFQTTASGQASNSSNSQTVANGIASHAEGSNTTSIGTASHSEGGLTIASGNTSHAEGYLTTSIGVASHAEGNLTTAIGDSSHSEGDTTTAIGVSSHAEGSLTIASGTSSHAEGSLTTAIGNYSHVSGVGTVSYNTGEWVMSSGSQTIGKKDQYGSLSFAANTTGNTITEVFVGGIASERMPVPNNSARYCRLYATAIETTSTTGATKQFLGDGLIKNITGTTVMVGTLTMASTYGDPALAAATITVTADNTNDSLKIEVTGIAATNINWFIRLDYEQVQI